jgi:hypothetical protein
MRLLLPPPGTSGPMGPLDVITAPARLAATVGGGAIGVAIDVLQGARGLLSGDSDDDTRVAATPEGTRNRTPTRPVAREPVERPPAPSTATPMPAAEPPAEEEHVDEGAVLVAEVAESGAEDGAGPELEVEEPWENYDRMTAEEIGDRLSAASREAVAAVQLYEAVTKSRDSVLEATERRLRELMPPPAASS